MIRTNAVDETDGMTDHYKAPTEQMLNKICNLKETKHLNVSYLNVSLFQMVKFRVLST